MFVLRRPLARCRAVAIACVMAAACGQTPPSRLDARLVEDPANPSRSYIEVSGIDSGAHARARRAGADAAQWTALFDVRVRQSDGSTSDTIMAGSYAVVDGTLRFTPLFPFDPGRHYEVRYYGDGSNGSSPRELLRKTVAAHAAAPSPPTYVTRVYPSAGVVPENQLRIYVHFSAPMGRRGGLGHIRLLDGNGREVPEPFLPLDAEFWNADRTRYTLFFDPGRQKRGILPNREMGPSLVAGRRYTLVIDREWVDGQGNPLGRRFTHQFLVGPPDLQPIDAARWRLTPPVPGSRDPLTVEFPESLDHGLLQRAIGVRHHGQPVLGEIRVDALERRWTLTPADAWRTGTYELIALSILEDLAGNRIGRPFEADSFDRIDRNREPEVTTIPFALGSGT